MSPRHDATVPAVVTCLNCGEVFETYRRAVRYCGQACREERRRKPREAKPREAKPRAIHPTMTSGKPCGRPDGHTGECRSVGAVERHRAASRAHNTARRAVESVCSSAGCERVAPVGRERCPECERARQPGTLRRRRERKAAATYVDLLDLDPWACYLCGSEVPEGSGHVEHVVPVSRFAEYAAEAVEGFASAVRRACGPCNRSKSDRDPARFVLDRWARGLPVGQAVVPRGHQSRAKLLACFASNSDRSLMKAW